MIKKNLLKAVMITILTTSMLTACNKNNTGTVPETQSVVETTKETKESNTETKEDSSTTEQTTAETTTEQETTTKAHTHSYTSSITTEANCTTEGVMTFTCECGDTYTESIQVTAHSYGDYTYNNDATEEMDGTETAVCSVCGAKDTRTAAGTKLEHKHNYTPYVSTYPTCTTEGVMTSACGCGDSYTEPISATGHSFGDYAYNNDATYEADGTETTTCSVCGAKDTRTATGTKLVEELQSFFDWMKEYWNDYYLLCLSQEGFSETIPCLGFVSDIQCFVYYAEGGDTSLVDEFIKTHDMTIWDKSEFTIGEFKEGIVHEVEFSRNLY